MQVYILTHAFQTPNNDCCNVIGVFSTFGKATKAMKQAAETLRAKFSPEFWHDDLTYTERGYIHLGHHGKGYECDSVYQWCITMQYLDGKRPEK